MCGQAVRETGIMLGLNFCEPHGVKNVGLKPFEKFALWLVNAIVAFNAFPFEGTIVF